MTPGLWMLIGAGIAWGSSFGLFGLVVLGSALSGWDEKRRARKAAR